MDKLENKKDRVFFDKLTWVYSGCQKNVEVFKRFFYNRTFFYTAIPSFEYNCEKR